MSLIMKAAIFWTTLHVVYISALPNPVISIAHPYSHAQWPALDQDAGNHPPNLVARVLPNEPIPSQAGDAASSSQQLPWSRAPARSPFEDIANDESEPPMDSQAGGHSPPSSPGQDSLQTLPSTLGGPGGGLGAANRGNGLPSSNLGGRDGAARTHLDNTVLFRTLTSKRQNGGEPLNAQAASEILDQPQHWLKMGKQSLAISQNEKSPFVKYWKRFAFAGMPATAQPFFPVIDVRSDGDPVETVLLSTPISNIARGVRVEFESQDKMFSQFTARQEPWMELRIVPAGDTSPDGAANTRSYPLPHEMERQTPNNPSIPMPRPHKRDQGWHAYTFTVELVDILQGAPLPVVGAGATVQLVAHAQHKFRGITVLSANVQVYGLDGLMDKLGSRLSPGETDPLSRFPVVSNAVYLTKSIEMAADDNLVTYDTPPGIYRDEELKDSL